MNHGDNSARKKTDLPAVLDKSPGALDHIDPLRVIVRFKNNRLIRLREDLGMTAKKLSEAIGISYSKYCELESMRTKAFGRQGWKESALAIATFHGVGPSDLWPEEVLRFGNPKAERTLGSEDVGHLVDGQPGKSLLDKEELALVSHALSTLTEREQKVLCMRFGLRGETPSTLREIGKNFDRSAELARKIEARALRKLRHPSRARTLGPLLFPDIPSWMRKK